MTDQGPSIFSVIGPKDRRTTPIDLDRSYVIPVFVHVSGAESLEHAHDTVINYFNDLELDQDPEDPRFENILIGNIEECSSHQVCYLCRTEIPDGQGSKHDVLDGDGFGRMNALLCEECAPIAPNHDENQESDVDDDFPMSVEYDGMYGAPDFLVEQTAQDEEVHNHFAENPYGGE